VFKAVSYFRKSVPNAIEYLSKACFDGLLMPVSLSVLTPLLLLLFSFAQGPFSDSSLSNKLQALMVLVSTSVVSLVFWRGVQRAVTDREDSEKSAKTKRREAYVAVFEAYLLLQALSLVLWLQIGLSFVLYFMLLLEVGSFVWVLRGRPYPNCFENLNLLLNLSLVVFFQAAIILREKGVLSPTQENDVLVCLAIGGLIGLSAIFSSIRVLREIVRRVRDCCKGVSSPESDIANGKQSKERNRALLEEGEIK
jgi:hypothetical protein